MSLAPYWFLVIVRIALTLLPQTGYIHPDEFFQSVEIVVGDVLQVKANKPWEFNTTSPIRSISVPYAVVGAPSIVLKFIAPFFRLWFDLELVTPYAVLAGPRLVMCLASFIMDFCMYKICCLYGQNYRARMLILGSSYVVLVYGTRTFSNTIEMILTSVLICLVAHSMAKTDEVIYEDEKLRECYNRSKDFRERVRLHRMRLSLPWHTFSNVFSIATVTVIGVFNRPTFLVFAFPPIFFWLQRGFGSTLIGIADFNMRVLALVTSSIPALALLVLVDSTYYGFLTFDLIVQRNVSIVRDLVFTPYNFIKYNADTTNLALHGIHPRIMHFLVNVPLLFNVLGIAGLFGFIHLVYRGVLGKYSSLPRVQSIIGLMTASFIIPIALLSIFPHQEPRFIIPVTFPLVFLYSQLIRPTNRVSYYQHDDTNIALSIWYLLNISLTVFFGFIHQAGIYPLLVDLHSEMQVKPKLVTLHLATSHIYSLPVSLLLIKQGRSRQVLTETGSRYQQAKDFFSYEFGSSLSVDMAAIKLQMILHQCEIAWVEKRMKYRLYYVIPSSMADTFQAVAFNYNMTASVSRVFYPHLTTEALPSAQFDPISSCSFQNLHDCLLNTSTELLYSSLKFVSTVAHQTGLTLFRLTPHEPPPKSKRLDAVESPLFEHDLSNSVCEARSFFEIHQVSACYARTDHPEF